MNFIIVLTILFYFGNFINCDEGTGQTELFNVGKSAEHNNHALESEKFKNSAINTQSLTTNKNSDLNSNIFQQFNPSVKTNDLVNFYQNQPIPLQSLSYAFPDNKPATINFLNKQGGRRSFSNRIKSFVNSLFWKDSSNSYLPSDSNNFFSFKQLPSFKILSSSMNDQSLSSSLKENFGSFAFKPQNNLNSFQNFDYNFVNSYKSLNDFYNAKPSKFIVNSFTNKFNNNYQNNNLGSKTQISSLSFPENKIINSQHQPLLNNLNSEPNLVNPYPKVTNNQKYKNDLNENNQNDKSLNNMIKNALVLNIDNNFIKSLQ